MKAGGGGRLCGVRGWTAILVILCFTVCANRHEDSVLALAGESAGRVRGVLVIGDSLDVYSDGFGLASELSPAYRVFHKGFINYDFERWSIRVDEAFAEAVLTPEMILVPLGTNDAFRYDGSTILPVFREFHRQLRLRSAAPVVYFRMPRTRDTSIQARVIEIGGAIAVNLPDNARFLDLDALFVRAGTVPPLYTDFEVLHPNERGNGIIREAMKNAVLGL